MVHKLQDLLNNLPAWWNKSDDSNNYRFLKSFATELDLIEADIENMRRQVYIDTASGKYLNELGKLFRLFRKELETDSEFRNRIISFWPGFSGGGAEISIKQAIERTTGITEDGVVIHEQPDLKIEVEVELSESSPINTIIDIVQRSKAAGIYQHTYFTFIPDETLMVEAISQIDITLVH